MVAYYNENDPKAAHVLRTQIRLGVIADGFVDDRSIKDVQAYDLRGFTQCHWFAGGGFWSIAARMAGWHDGRPIWTASCPCQPFSGAGNGEGINDPRHLWPDLFRIYRAARQDPYCWSPSVIVGEQVSSKAGLHWFDGIRADLASTGSYARSIDFPACAVNAPHQRNRQYWVSLADTTGDRFEQEPSELSQSKFGQASGITDTRRLSADDGALGRFVGTDLFGPLNVADGAGIRQEMARHAERFSRAGGGRAFDRGAGSNDYDRFNMEFAEGTGFQRFGWNVNRSGRSAIGAIETGRATATDDPFAGRDMADHNGPTEHPGRPEQARGTAGEAFGGPLIPSAWSEPSYVDGCGVIPDPFSIGRIERRDDHGGDVGNVVGSGYQLDGCISTAGGNYWSDAEWIVCHDNKARRTQPDIRFLVDGLPGRVDLWSIGGNAIVPQAAALVIETLREVLDDA